MFPLFKSGMLVSRCCMNCTTILLGAHSAAGWNHHVPGDPNGRSADLEPLVHGADGTMMRIDYDDVDGNADGTVLFEGAPFTGEVVDHWPDGTVQSLTTYRDGVEDGPYREWHRNGTLRTEGRSDLRHGAVGVWREWDASGRLVSEKSFGEDGELDTVRRWDRDGRLVEEKVFRPA